MRLSTQDYVKILNHYTIPLPYKSRFSGKLHSKSKKDRKDRKDRKDQKDQKDRKPRRSIDAQKTRKLAHKILAMKLCKCIKRVQKSNPLLKEQNAIPICINQIFKKHGIKPYRFTCKKQFKLHGPLPRKGHKIRQGDPLSKTRKNIYNLK
jgi:hypothetical protein